MLRYINSLRIIYIIFRLVHPRNPLRCPRDDSSSACCSRRWCSAHSECATAGCPAGSGSWATATPTSTSSIRPTGDGAELGGDPRRDPGAEFRPFSAEVAGASPATRGYAFNWARSDATTDDLIATGQHTGLAAQVARGEVGHGRRVHRRQRLHQRPEVARPAGDVGATLPRALANHRLAVRTILDASPRVKLVLVTLPDIRNLPEFAGPIRAGPTPSAVADAFTAAIRRFNAADPFDSPPANPGSP